MDTLFFFIVTVFFFVALKIHEWSALFHLGFKMEVPQVYIDRRTLFSYIPLALFIAASLSFFGVSDRFLAIGGITLLAVWFLSRFLGEMHAFARYRFIVTEMLSIEKGKKSKKMLEKELGKTDKRLREEIRTMEELFRSPDKMF